MSETNYPMAIIVDVFEEPDLKAPILIEGLPGTGFVANIAALHLITELKAKKFAEIRSPAFQDIVISAEGGTIRYPVNELYYHHSGAKNDFIILYGNTQALTAHGQYGLYGEILDIAQDFGCKFVACMGGLRRGKVVRSPRVYGTATDHETLNRVLKFNVKILRGHVTGAAGLLVGLAKLRGMSGFCLLAETSGFYPDAAAAKAVLEVLCKILDMEVNLTRLDKAVKGTEEILKSFGFPSALQKPEYPTFV